MLWLNGRLVDKALVEIDCHTLHYGTGAFEGIRAYKQKDGKPGIFRLKDHIDRLFYSVSVLGKELPYSKEVVIDACKTVIKANSLEEAYIRPIVYFSFGKLGLAIKEGNPNLAVLAFPFTYIPSPPRVKISSLRRIHEINAFLKAKLNGYYVLSTIAHAEAEKFGYDEALLLDKDGYVAEGPGENIFFIYEDELYTPKEGSILPGITRDTIMKIAKDLDFRVKERNILPEELSDFEEAFFVGTAIEVMPIKEIEGIRYKTDKGMKIREYYLKVVRGEIEKYSNWIEKVE